MSEAVSEPVADRLHTTSLGSSGPRIAFLHGLFGQGRNWTQIAKALADEYRPTLFDLPNHGRSSWTQELSYPQMAEAVAAELERLAPGERWIVLGHSMGGKVAMLLTLTRPELVDRLVVVDIAPIDYGPHGQFEGYIAGMKAMPLATIESRVDADQAAQQWVPDPGVRAFLLQNLRREGDGWRWAANLELLGRSLGVLGGWPAEVLQGRAPYDGPTLWICGAQSQYAPSPSAEAMRALFPRVRTVTVKGAGHWVHSEKPDVFLSAVRTFLAADRS